MIRTLLPLLSNSGVARLAVGLVLAGATTALALVAPPTSLPETVARIAGPWEQAFPFQGGQAAEISARVVSPGALPANGRLRFAWIAPDGAVVSSKTLHALDPDTFFVFRAPAAGSYRLRLAPQEDGPWPGDSPRWREKGQAPNRVPSPSHTPWPAGRTATIAVSVRPVDARPTADTAIECEPNDTPDLAQPIALPDAGPDEIRTFEVAGTADDTEFFDNGAASRLDNPPAEAIPGEDWYRVDFPGKAPRLLTAQLGIPGQSVAARIRVYRRDADGKIVEYRDGAELNERVHQQEETHRSSVCRLVSPGQSLLLRVEANAPLYQLQLRVLPPAPYTDPTMAIRQGMYTQIGQVDAWLTNRPRGASVERRIRDSGNLLGTACMSCHTQSGVWGPAGAIATGYRVENQVNFRHLIDVMYECLRPTNELKDAANNTSLAPLDIGDGPAGTRAAGFNIVRAERIRKPLRLQSAMQRRTANYVLLTGDPGGINAAGPGSNFGQVVVHVFAGEILATAWEKTHDPKYRDGLAQRTKAILAASPKVLDDIALRLHYFCAVQPREAAAAKAVLDADEARLRALQNPDGSWSFHPGTTADRGKTWQRANDPGDPSPTALAVLALAERGAGPSDPAVARGVAALLKMQEPSGRWNKAAQTGFVTSAYVLHALSALYPAPKTAAVAETPPRPGEPLAATVGRVLRRALSANPAHTPYLRAATTHPSALARAWALVGLGMNPAAESVPPVARALSEGAKPVREAAIWALRQHLLDDRGWEAALTLGESGDDRTRESVARALQMRADAVLSQSSVPWPRLTALLAHGMNDDRHPGVRAWSAKAAWPWWVWNPPARAALNAAWERMLLRTEPDALTENALRYSSHALFIANGHRANGSGEHQYKELADLFKRLSADLDRPGAASLRLAGRLVGIAATFVDWAGGDGGPGQMGYATPGSAEMMGKATLAQLKSSTVGDDLARVRLGLEAASGTPYGPLTDFVVNYSLSGPEAVRPLASRAVSDPRSVRLAGVPELVAPQRAQVDRGAREPGRREQLSDPILGLWGKVNWDIPNTEEQQVAFFDLLIPRLNEIPADPRERDAAWYLADGLGGVLASNPDLHREIVLRRYFPARFANALEERFWIRSVGWILTYRGTLLTPGRGPSAPDDAALGAIQDRALQLFLDQLRASAEPATRAVAIRMANQTALRSNPEVLRALRATLAFETNPESRKIVENVLKQSAETFLPELMAALKEEKHPSVRFDSRGEPVLTKAQEEDILTFRDYVLPEMSRQKRTDQLSCLGCHGVPGRVPSLGLRATDAFGYQKVSDLLYNYRQIQARVNLADLERSKILRKPLNIQDGKEDGHQGGRRYNSPDEEGYQVLRRWAAHQTEVQQPPR